MLRATEGDIQREQGERNDRTHVVPPSVYVACLFVRDRRSGASPDSAHAFFKNSCYSREEAASEKHFDSGNIHYENPPRATHQPLHGSSHPHTDIRSKMI